MSFFPHPYPSHVSSIENGNSLSTGNIFTLGYNPNSDDVRDLTVFRNHGILKGGATHSTAYVAYGAPPSIFCNGTSGYIEIPISFDQSAKWTVIVRLVTGALNGSGIQWIVAMEDGTGTGYGLLGINHDSSSRLVANHYSGVGKLGNASYTVASNKEYVLGIANSNNTARFIYQDSNMSAPVNAGAITGTVAANKGKIRIGLHKNGGLGTQMQVVSVLGYNRQLTLADIQSCNRLPANKLFFEEDYIGLCGDGLIGDHGISA